LVTSTFTRALRFAAWALALLSTALLPAVPLAAQETGQIRGTVTGAASGQALAGVRVSVEGTAIRQLTDAQGRFLLLDVPAGLQTVTASFIGYGQGRRQLEVPAGDTVTVDFALAARAVALEGVVVTGTASAAQLREIGNSIAVISAAEIEQAGAVNLDDVLRGHAPGLQVQGQAGVAGAGSQIFLRGLSSINGRNRPLIYVDGIRINDRGSYESSGNTADQAATVLNSINPQDIDRIEIIKGAAASTVYGTEASAGVIQIFTKRGAAGRAQWTFSEEQGVAVPRHVGPKSDPSGLHLNDCRIGGPLRPTQTQPDPGCPASGSWLQNAHKHDYRLSVRGGSDAYNYFASAGFGRTEGIANVPERFDPQASRDVNIRANVTFQPFDAMQIRLNNSYTRRDIQWIEDGDNDEGFTENVIKLDQGETPGDDDALVFQSDIDQDIDHFTTGVNVNFTPSAKFSHRLNLGLDWSRSETIRLRPLGFWNFAAGSRFNDAEVTRVLTVDYAGSWFADVGDSWTSTLEWGGQLNDREDRGLRIDCTGFIAPGNRVATECQQAGFETGGLGLQEDRRGFRSGGFLLQERVGWNNRLFVTAGFRADAFSQINRELDLTYDFLIYPKAQLTYTLSDHDFWPDQLETFRLRAAWGESGDPPPQDALQTLWQIAGADELPRSGFIIQSLSSPGIKPERTGEFEFGLDASAFDGRLSLQATYFTAKTRDGIIFNPLLPSGGVVENIATNEGEWKRWGIETSFDVVVVESPRYRLGLSGLYSWRDSEILSLGRLGVGSPQSTATVGFNQRFTEGRAFPQFFGEPVSNPNEFALPQRGPVQDLGTTIPTTELSLGLSFTLRNRLTLDVFGAGQFGHVLLDEGAEEAATDGVWPQCVGVDDNLTDHLTNGTPLEFNAATIARCSTRASVGGVALAGVNEDWLFKADYFRIQSASLTYRLPESWLPRALTGAQVQFRVTNVALFTGYPTDTDPDAILGAANNELFRSGGFTLPAPRTYSLNLRVNF
jgi:outer membrane receptor protein involved in Fe transport